MTLRDQLVRDEGLRLKACSTCGPQPISAFGKCAKARDGLNWYCLACARKKSHANNTRTPEALAKRKAISRRFYERHKDAENSRGRTWARNKYAKLREEDEKNLQRLLLLSNAKNRAKKHGVPFALTLDDVPLTYVCPVLGVPLTFGRGRPTGSSASIDRIIPSRGYVPGNVIVISMRANVIKSDGTPEEILKVGLFFQKVMDGMQ